MFHCAHEKYIYVLEYRQICKCRKNVFVQCELWCDEILRKIAQPCCSCVRHLSKQALSDLAPPQLMTTSPSSMKVFAPGIQISLQECPARQSRLKTRSERPCPAMNPACNTTSYLMYSTSPTRSPNRELNEYPVSERKAYSTTSQSIMSSLSDYPKYLNETIRDQQSLIRDIYAGPEDQTNLNVNIDSTSSDTSCYYSPIKMSQTSIITAGSERESHLQSTLAMMATTHFNNAPSSSWLSSGTNRLDNIREYFCYFVRLEYFLTISDILPEELLR